MPGPCRSATTASSPTARSPRWSRPAARSTGCACRAWTPRASSARSSAGTPARSGSRRSDVTVPAARRYLPGTMILETSWGTADRLDHRPRRAADRAVAPRGRPVSRRTAAPPPTTTPSTSCCARSAASRARCRPSWTASRCSTTAAARSRWEYTDTVYHQGARRRRRLGHRADPDHRHAARLRGRPGERPHPAQGGRHPLRRAVLGRRGAAARPTPTRTGGWSGPRTTGSTGWPAAASPTTRGAATCSAARSPSRASPTRRPARSPRRPPPRCRRRSAANRNYDYRYTWIRDATFALWGMYSLGFDWEAVDFFSFIADIAEQRRRPADHVRHRRRARPRPSTSSTTCPGYADSRPVRIGNAAYAQQQHDVWGALLDSVYLHSKAADHLDGRIWPILDKQVGAGAQALARAGRRHLGGARRAAALHLVQDHVLGRRRPRRPAGRDDRARTPRPPSGSWPPTRSRPTSSSQRRRRARRAHPVLRHARRWTRRCCSRRCVRFLPPDDPRIRATVLAIADELTVDGLVLRYRVEETDDGFSGEEGTLHDLLVLAGVGAVRDRRVRAGPQAVRQAAVASPARWSSTPRRSTRTAASTSATSRRRSPTWR